MEKIVLSFNDQQLEIIHAALGELPHKYAAPLIAHINKQIQEQFNAAVDRRNLPSGATAEPDEFAGD